MANVSIPEVIGAFSTAGDMRAYNMAKRLAARLPSATQLEVIDAAIAARKRIAAL